MSALEIDLSNSALARGPPPKKKTKHRPAKKKTNANSRGAKEQINTKMRDPP
jgi:hypothetical protein